MADLSRLEGVVDDEAFCLDNVSSRSGHADSGEGVLEKLRGSIGIIPRMIAITAFVSGMALAVAACEKGSNQGTTCEVVKDNIQLRWAGYGFTTTSLHASFLFLPKNPGKDFKIKVSFDGGEPFDAVILADGMLRLPVPFEVQEVVVINEFGKKCGGTQRIPFIREEPDEFYGPSSPY